MEFRILGPTTVVDQGHEVELGAPKARTALACLLIHANTVVSVDQLVEAIWGESPPETAVHSLQNHVSNLRKALRRPEGAPIGTEHPGYVLRTKLETIDAHRFERLLSSGRSQLRHGRHAEAVAALTSALAEFRGEPLADVAYEEFAQPEIRRYRELKSEAEELLYEAKIAQGRSEDILGDLERFVDEHPLRERATKELMLALAATGRSTEALSAFEDYRGRLHSELRLEPSGEMKALVRKIRESDDTPAGVPPPRSNGQHRTEVADQAALDDLLSKVRADVEARRRLRGSMLPLALAALLALVVVTALLVPVRTPSVAVLFAGRGDDGWGDLIAAGVDAAGVADEFRLEERLVSLSDGREELEAKLDELARRADLVVVGWTFAADALENVAPAHPETFFVMIDAPIDLPNVASFVFAEDEGARLMGAAAALASESSTIGFIGGADLPLIDRYRFGFEDGARAVDPEIEVLAAYLASPDDPIRGFIDTVAAGAAAMEMYGRGADVIFHAAGRAGNGIMAAARLASEETGTHRWMIGVDVDEYAAAPAELKPFVLTSMLEHAELVTEQAIVAHFGGTLEPGITELGLRDDAIGYATSGGFLAEHEPTLQRLLTELVSER